MPVSVDLSDVPEIAEAFARARAEGRREGMATFVARAIERRFPGAVPTGVDIEAGLARLAEGDIRAVLASAMGATRFEDALGPHARTVLGEGSPAGS